MKLGRSNENPIIVIDSHIEITKTVLHINLREYVPE